MVPKSQLLNAWHGQLHSAERRSALIAWLQRHVLVVDDSGAGWMTRWKQQFEQLDIEHLRSTVAAHPDPMDSYALGMWAQQQGRSDELRFMTDAKRDKLFHGPFAVPGTSLFDVFCSHCIRR